MGYYINPENMTKEEFLYTNATPIRHYDRKFNAKESGKFTICLVFNSFFTAAAVCFSENEFKEFNTDDGRAKLWYEIDIDKLIGVVAGIENII